ncbi:ribulose-phosphate 3-epimerase [Rickettsiales endosymbiont of Peranema trichophorum]|uniref:ribulose-phosphate 3-epimerase n=1 Tax=Rickettsiales endosymbiont of Peranema trichophorum TaxID=2486577 RepID=UPI001023373C|nr:ribulose-phosphate 3-epimerase [Rickettsiales endosymbiont of Peranema trichophorum]RZI46000.1 ribulose-phosphate 3-epimerase [Rickettsiales endosymbiont of Peranema trichophorum]
MLVKISPSIIAADLSNLRQEVIALTDSGADYIHFDVMDGVFVPNITIGADTMQACRKWTNVPFDVHLMIANPARYIESFVQAGADIITVHVESHDNVHNIIKSIKSYGKKAGVAINPTTHESTLDYLYEEVDVVLVMTVNPGFCGQEFISNQLQKIRNIAAKIKERQLSVQIHADGGITPNTGRHCISHGANTLVAGSSVFKDSNYAQNISELKTA